MRHGLVLLLALAAAPALAADSVVPSDGLADEDEDLFGDSGATKGNNANVPDETSFDDEDDLDIPSFTQPPKPAVDEEKDLSAFVDPRSTVGSTTKMPLDTIGKGLLGDNWAPQIVVLDADALVIEMPVLYARNRGEFDGVAYWLVAEAFADGKKVAESRVQVTRDAIADKGPSVQFFRLFTPVPAAAGVVVVNVSKASSAASKPTLLFTRSVAYKI